ncbi:MAG: ComEC/Rec2 family competence protein [Planctomycetota bacterium]
MIQEDKAVVASVDAADQSVSPVVALASANAFHRRRPLFWLALVFCVGIGGDHFLAPSLNTVSGVCLVVLLCIGFFLLFFKYRNFKIGRSNQKLSPKTICFPSISNQKSAIKNSLLFWRSTFPGTTAFICGAGVALIGGLLAHALLTRLPAADHISRRTSAAPSFVWLRGTVIEAAEESRPNGYKNWTLDISALGVDAESLTPASGRTRLTVTSSPDVAMSDIGEGDRLELRVRIESPPEVTLPESFDYSGYLAGQGILRTGAVFLDSVRKIAGPAWWRPDLILRRCSTALARRVESLLPTDNAAPSSQAALLNAILFGRRERLDVSDREAFAISGTAHLLAISGLHIQFLAWLLFRITVILGLSRRRAAWIILLFACAYCAMSGANAPIVRATVMIVLYLGSHAFYREADPLNVLGASALAILVVSPAELFNAGFQLSFLAVLSLITLCPAFEMAWLNRQVGPMQSWLHSEQISRHRQFANNLCRALFVSLAAWLGTAPVVAWHMGRFSTLSLIVNLIAVPLNSICMVAGLCMLAVDFFSTAVASIVGWGAWLSLFLLQTINSAVAALPFAAIDLPPPSLPVLLIYTAALVWIWVARERGVTAVRLAVVTLGCLLMLNAGLLFRETLATTSVTMLDLRNGHATLLESPDGAALIGAGGVGQGARIAELLRRKGITRLNLLVISTDEKDAIAGAVELLKRVQVARVLFPRAGAASAARRELEQFLTARAIPYGSPDLEKILPGPGDSRWEFKDDGRTADTPAGAESALTVRLTLPGVRLLFVTARSASSLQRLLTKVSDTDLQADALCLSPGEFNRWAFDIAQLARRSGCRVIIANSNADPSELPGLDLAAFTDELRIRLLSPCREGSLRVSVGSEARLGWTLQAFRNGQWRFVD